MDTKPRQPADRGSGSSDPLIIQCYSHGRVVQMPSLRGRSQDLRDRLRAWNGRQEAPLLGTELNYVRATLQATPLPTTSIRPAYLDPSAAALALEDTTQGREVELTAEVVAKARALGTAQAAAEFVRNDLRLDWYYGSLKGSTETLREGRGTALGAAPAGRHPRHRSCPPPNRCSMPGQAGCWAMLTYLSSPLRSKRT